MPIHGSAARWPAGRYPDVLQRTFSCQGLLTLNVKVRCEGSLSYSAASGHINPDWLDISRAAWPNSFARAKCGREHFLLRSGRSVNDAK